jgi:hypothetical protein
MTEKRIAREKSFITMYFMVELHEKLVKDGCVHKKRRRILNFSAIENDAPRAYARGFLERKIKKRTPKGPRKNMGRRASLIPMILPGKEAESRLPARTKLPPRFFDEGTGAVSPSLAAHRHRGDEVRVMADVLFRQTRRKHDRARSVFRKPQEPQMAPYTKGKSGVLKHKPCRLAADFEGKRDVIVAPMEARHDYSGRNERATKRILPPCAKEAEIPNLFLALLNPGIGQFPQNFFGKPPGRRPNDRKNLPAGNG